MPSKFMTWDTVLAIILVLIFRFVFKVNSVDLVFFLIVWFMVSGFTDSFMRIEKLAQEIGDLRKEVDQIKSDRIA